MTAEVARHMAASKSNVKLHVGLLYQFQHCREDSNVVSLLPMRRGSEELGHLLQVVAGMDEAVYGKQLTEWLFYHLEHGVHVPVLTLGRSWSMAGVARST